MGRNFQWILRTAYRRPFLWIILLGLLVYIRNIFFGFVYFDDNVLVLDNLFFLKSLSNLPSTFTMEVFHVLHASAAYYRPLLTISYMLDAQISGVSPIFYHLTSVVIHIVNACLIYILFNKLRIKKELSLIFSLVFVVHPILAQAVSWIPGRNDSLLALFLIPSFIFFIDYFENMRLRSYFLHMIFFYARSFYKRISNIYPNCLFICRIYLWL